MEAADTFSFTDADLYLRFNLHPFTSFHGEFPDALPHHSFPSFEHPALIEAIYELNYRKAYRLLKELTEPLAPQEAAAACLCAVLGSDRLLNAVLDHCPPIPQFQFKGVGLVSNLVALVTKFDLEKKLRILLRRGADPNRGGDCQYPLEIAFTYGSYSSLLELLKAPNLEIQLTEPILNTWGRLSTSPDAEGNDLLFQWCCQLTCEKLDSPQFPGIPQKCIPPQLRPRHAFAHNNQPLAMQICETNPLTEDDLDDLYKHFSGQFPNPTSKHGHFSQETQWSVYSALLKVYMQHIPDCLDDPILRRAIASAAVGPLTPDEEIISAAARLSDGPVLLKTDDIFRNSLLSYMQACFFETTFLTRWSELLGDRLPPALDLSELTAELLGFSDSNTLLEELIFIGSATESQWDEILPPILQKLQNNALCIDQLLQPGKILTHAPADKLLALLPQLSLKQRGAILLHTKKKTDYAL